MTRASHEWEGLDEFIQTLQHWSDVQRYLEEIRAPVHPGTRLLAFDAPNLRQNRLVIPNGPAREPSSEGYEELSIILRGGDYWIVANGEHRGTAFTDVCEATFSSLALAGKYFLSLRDRTFRRYIGLDPIISRWVRQGVAPGWEKIPTADDPGLPYKFFRTEDPATYFSDGPAGELGTYPLSMSYQEITDLYMTDVPQPPADWTGGT